MLTVPPEFPLRGCLIPAHGPSIAPRYERTCSRKDHAPLSEPQCRCLRGVPALPGAKPHPRPGDWTPAPRRHESRALIGRVGRPSGPWLSTTGRWWEGGKQRWFTSHWIHPEQWKHLVYMKHHFRGRLTPTNSLCISKGKKKLFCAWKIWKRSNKDI